MKAVPCAVSLLLVSQVTSAQPYCCWWPRNIDPSDCDAQCQSKDASASESSCTAPNGVWCGGDAPAPQPHPIPTPSPTDIFQSDCGSDEDYGWPRFADAVQLGASPWASYFSTVYGELPTAYPVCTFDFWDVNKTALDAAGIEGHNLVPSRPQTPQGDTSEWEWKDGEFFERIMTGWVEESDWYKGFAIFHSFSPISPAHTWIEVRHRAVDEGGEAVGMWLTYARGSGVWFNVGETRVFDGGVMSHTNAFQALCETTSTESGDNEMIQCARDKTNLDSIQFAAWTMEPAGSWGLADMFELVAVHLSGTYPCGSAEGGVEPGFRSGWRASRECYCTNDTPGFGTGWLNCNGAHSVTLV